MEENQRNDAYFNKVNTLQEENDYLVSQNFKIKDNSLSPESNLCTKQNQR